MGRHSALSILAGLFAMTALAPSPALSAGLADARAEAADRFDMSLPAPKPSRLVDVSLPMPRPDLVEFWGATPVDMQPPLPKPGLKEMLPAATLTIAETMARETRLVITDEKEFKLASGDTLGRLLDRAGFKATRQTIINQLSAHLAVNRLPVGMSFKVGYGENSQAMAIRFAKEAGLDYLLMQTTTELSGNPLMDWQGLMMLRPTETKLAHAKGTITQSLSRATRTQDVPPYILDQFVRVMGFAVDFQREIRKGDSFEMVFERDYDSLTGKEIGSPELVYAGLTVSGEKLGYYKYAHRDGKIGWYDDKGQSATRTLMRTPINGARLSSSYGMRKHPIKGYNAMHKGVDFAAPKGTPILAAGSGRVEFAAWNGSYGRYIRIRHNSTYKTAYAHLSGIARGVRSGAMVEQGQIIGYVGSTGRSTGPHLHYEIIVNNRQVNPLTVKLPTGKSVPAAELPIFQDEIAALKKQNPALAALQAGQGE